MKTLIWKEWREQRLFFFLAVGLIILSRVVIKLIPKTFLDDEIYSLSMSLFILPSVFSFFLGSTSFTNEFTRNTKPFLLTQPITAAKLFWVKYFSGLTLVIILVLVGIGILFAPVHGFLKSLTGTPTIWTLLGVTYFFFSVGIIYSAACFSSLLLKNSLLAILCTPFILLFGLLLVPFAIFLFWISPNLYIFACFLFPVLIAIFLAFGFLTWRKAVVKDVSSGKIVLMISLTILLISFGFHAIANLTATIKLHKVIRQTIAQGIKIKPEEVIPPLVPDKDNAALVYQQAFDLADHLKEKYKTEWEYILISRRFYNYEF